MANFSTSEYGKYAQIQNISGSAESDAPEGGVYLFASGAAGSSKLYLQKEGSTDKYELGGDLKIAADAGSDSTVSIGKGQKLTIAGGTGLDTTVSNQTITFSMDLNELSDTAMAVGADSIVFVDADDNGSKKESFSDVVGNMAGAGLGASSGVLAVANATNGGLTVNADDIAVNLNDLAAAAVDVANDSIAIIDANASNGSKKESIADLVGAMAGTVTSTGLGDSSGVISVDINNLTGESTPVDGDLVMVYDLSNTALRKMTRAEFIEGAALDAINIDGGAIDGTPIGANSANTGKFTTLTATGNAAVSGSLHVVGDLDVVGAINSVTKTETTLEIEDKLIIVASGSNAANSADAGLQFGGHNAGGGAAAILYDNPNSAIDFNIAGTTEVRLQDGVFRPEADSDVTLGADTIAWSKLFVDDIDLNGVGRIDLDADADTSIRSSADDQIDFEVGGADLVAIKSTGLHIVDDKKLVFGSNDDASFEYDEDGNNVLLYSGASIRIADDTKIEFGAGGDASIEYDEDGTDELRFAGAAVTFEQNVSFDEDVTLGLTHFDTVNVAAALTASEGMLVKDDKKLMFGNGADASFEYDEDGNDVLLYSGASMRFADDTKLEFGAAGDASIEYDEDGTDQLRIAAPAAGVVIAGTTPTLVIGDAGAEDTKLVFDGNAQDFYMGLDDSADKLLLGLGSTVGTTPNMSLYSADRSVQFHGHIIAGANSIVDGGANSAITFDGSGNTAVVNSMTVGGGFGSSGVTLTAAGALQMDSNLQVAGTSLIQGDVSFSGSSNTAPDVTFKQDGDLNGFMRWDSSENNLYLQYGSGGGSGVQVLTLGGNATSDYALDVVNGSNNINKVRAAAFVTYSDESLKSDVETMNTALDTVMSLNGVEFTWKDSGERDFGFIAQDVQSVLPKAVHTADDGVQGVDYSRLTSVLVEAVKAQQVQIEDLKKVISNLKK